MYAINSNDPILFKFKLGNQMAEITLKALIYASLYYPLYALAWFANLDNIKSSVLVLFLLITGSIRFYRWMIRDSQTKRMKDLEIREKEIELMERENALIRGIKLP